ncbi:MAG: translation initiation factor [Bacteroidota bacterium]|jgi:translation initiation factor IF-2
MSELKAKKLMAVAKEFNVGTASIVDFLAKKGFAINNSPMEKLTPDMYELVQVEYDQDKKLKQRSESIQIRMENAGSKTAKAEKVAEPKVEAPIAKAPTDDILAKLDLPPLEEADTKPARATKAKASEPAPAEEAAPVPPAKEETAAPEVEAVGPTVLGKIDLDALNKPKKSTRGKKADDEPAKAEPKPEAKAEVKPAKKASPKKKSEEINVITNPVESSLRTEVINNNLETPLEQGVIENIVERKVLDGPKVLGSLDLSKLQNDATPGARKRKRIPVDKKGTNIPGKPGADRGGARGGTRGRGDDRVIDQNAIQDKIRQTMARIGGGGRGRSNKLKHRKEKRSIHAERAAAAENASDNSILHLTEFISVSELASLMNLPFTEVIMKCMELGMMVSINQRLDAEVIELVASEFGFSVEFIDLKQEAEEEIEEDVDSEDELLPRAPIVTIMGHVDHGKTSLLDYIRKANVVAGEAGGITQHIGAYEVTLPNGRQITFLDTPGHEAFTAMRARGTKVTDIAVIVIAADDAVMPQTREAISHAQAAGVPMIFAINKMDKDGANPQKIYEQLSGMNVLVEEWGGKFQSQPIAAKAGTNVDLLLEKILLESDLLDLKANPDRYATGTVIESNLDKGRGYVATVLVQTGTLEIGEMMVAGTLYGRIKAMTDERGHKVVSAGPSTPVQILGLNGAPQAGEKFKIYEDEDQAKEIANHRSQIMREQGMRTRKHITLDEIGRRLALGNFKELKVIIKGDVDGSVEALSDSLIKLSTQEVQVNVIQKGVGAITESDVNLAIASDAIMIGFQVRPTGQAATLAQQESIEIKFYSVIYDAINDVKNAMEGLLEPKIEQKPTCNIDVQQVYKITGIGLIAGCLVTSGKIQRSNKVNVIRDGIVVHTGELAGLKRYKDDVKEVVAGTECGLSIKNYQDLREGDVIEGFEEIEVKRTLGS